MGLTFDKNGFMYVVDHVKNHAVRYAPNSLNATVVAGTAQVSSASLSNLDSPLGVAVDDNLNVYVADTDNRRVVRWAPNATSGTLIVGSGFGASFSAILLVPNSVNQLYLGSENDNKIYRWIFGSSTPTVTLTQVNGSFTSLRKPRGIKLDPYGNLYVADSGNGRIVMFCENASTSNVLVGGAGSTPTLSDAVDVAFDSSMNLYVVDESNDQVIKYARL